MKDKAPEYSLTVVRDEAWKLEPLSISSNEARQLVVPESAKTCASILRRDCRDMSNRKWQLPVLAHRDNSYSNTSTSRNRLLVYCFKLESARVALIIILWHIGQLHT